MTRREMVLAGLATQAGADYSPVQVQKLFFLLDRNAAHLYGGPLFSFTPYNYGPFDRQVYDELEHLADQGKVKFIPAWNWRNYRLTTEGQAEGEKILSSLPPKLYTYLGKASSFVRSLTFTQLVSAIYRAYPDMRANSVFQD